MNLKEKKFYKILPSNMICRGFQYKEGLNIDIQPFNDKECPNGLHFSDAEHILYFCGYGDLIAEVEIPENEEVLCFKRKYKAHSIILKNIKPLWDIEVFKTLVENGANIHVNEVFILEVASENGYLDIVKFLVKNGADIHALNDYALRYASKNGHLDVVKFLVESGANVHAEGDFALRLASQKGHFDVARYLIENGASMNTNDEDAL